MRGCLFTLLLGGVVVALVVVVGLPQVAAGLLTSALTAAGLEAEDTTVTVSSDPPTDLVGLRAERVRIRATDATFRGLRIGALDLELRDVRLVERTAAEVDGRLADVVVENVGGSQVALESIAISGGGDDLRASTVVPAGAVERLVADQVEAQLGVRPASVTLVAPNRMRVDLGVVVDGTLDVSETGDLVLLVPAGPASRDVVLLRGGEDLPILLTALAVTTGGDLRLTGDLTLGLLG